MPTELVCSSHPNRPLTNFCSSKSCMTSLCPQCLPVHLRAKKCEGLSIQLLEDAVDKAKLRGEQSIRELSQQIDHLTRKRAGVVSQNQKANQELLEDAKKDLLRMVDAFFYELKKKLGVEDTQERIKRTVRKYEKFKAQILGSMNSMGSQAQMDQAMQTLITLDTKAFLLNLRAQTDFLFSKSSIYKINFDASCLGQIAQILQAHIEIKQSPLPLFQPIPSSVQEHYQFSLPDHYRSDCLFKIVHQVIPHSNSLLVAPLESLGQSNNIKDKRLALSSPTIPEDSKSIITHTGALFVVGGISEQGRPQRQIYEFNFNLNSLQAVGSLVVARSDPSVVYATGNIYVVSGMQEGNHPLRKCEKYNIGTRQSTQIAACRYPGGGASLCTFQDKYLLKFGGTDANDRFISVLQKYDTRRDTWSIVELKFDPSIPPRTATMFVFKPYSLAQAINSDTVMITGGNEDSPFNQSVAILFEESDACFVVKSILPNRLPEKGFFLSSPVIYKKTLHAILSLPNGSKKVMISDLIDWVCLQ